MLLHQNNKFIYDNHVAVELPNNVYLDPCPDICPIEGIVLHSEDLLAKAEFHFLATEKGARAFLEETPDLYETFHWLKPIFDVKANGLCGFGASYETTRFIYDDYAFTIPGKEKTLLIITIEQKKSTPANSDLYAKFREELVSKFSCL